MDLFQGEMAFVGKPSRVSKSPGRIEPAEEAKTIAHMKGPGLFLQKEKQMAFDREMTAGSDDLLGSDQELGASRGMLGERSMTPSK